MKQKIFTFLLIAAAGFTACRKTDADPDIKEYDDQQIKSYISANSLTGLTRDTNGIYYKIINGGTGAPLEYSDRVSLVFTVKSLDGKFTKSDTLSSETHFDDFLGHLEQDGLPKGLQIAIHDILKYRDGSMRVLIPSNLAYGVNGKGTGSVSNLNSRIAGNQSLDYYVHVINDQQAYDDLVIRNYMTANGLSGYTKTATGLYYKVITPGTGAVGEITDLSTVTATYTGTLLNNAVFDETSKTTATTFAMSNIALAGLVTGLENYASTGTSISFIIPSRLAYGISPPQLSIIPVHAPLRFDYQISTVTQP